MANLPVVPALKWYSLSRLRLRWTAVILGLVSLGLLAVAYYFPFRGYIGPLRISLRSPRNPATLLAICALVWYLTSHRNFARLLAGRDATLRVWRHCGYGRRLVLIALVANVALGAVALVQYPLELLDSHKWYVIGRDSPAWVDRQIWHSYIQNFAQRCKRELPPDARILYHGHIEGMEFAYEIYPRRVFMLPGELYGIAATWHKQWWLKGMPDDPLEAYWSRDFPEQTTDRETFIREHGITHEVFFDSDLWFASRWEVVDQSTVRSRRETAQR